MKRTLITCILILTLLAALAGCDMKCAHTYNNACDAACNKCGAEREPYNNSAPPADSENCAITAFCTSSENTATTADDSHTPDSDGNCKTPHICEHCSDVILEAKADHIDTNGDYLCDNEGCRTPLDSVIIEIAYAYDRQGAQIPYDQLNARRSIYSTPEDATAQRTIFLDCSSFVNSVYREAFGVNVLPYEIVSGVSGVSPSTLYYDAYARDHRSSTDVVGYWIPQDYTTVAQREALADSIYASLQVGDVLTYRHGKDSGTSGHVYIYLGNDVFMHCAGAGSYVVNEKNPALSYDSNASEITSNGTIGTITFENIFRTQTSSRYIFKATDSDTVYSFGIIRPMARGLVPTEKTVSRMAIAGMSMEKTASVCENASVAIGSLLTYTITLQNTSANNYSGIVVKDILPEGVEYVSCDTQGTVTGNNLSWTVSVAGKSTVTISYTVRITETTPGALIVSNQTYVSKIKLGSIIHTVSCFSDSQKALIGDIAVSYNESEAFSDTIALIKAVYGEFDITLFEENTASDILDMLIDTTGRTYRTDTELSKMLVPNMYGGLDIRYGWLYLPSENEKTRLPKEEHLSVGDIIVADWDNTDKQNGTKGSTVYLYVGNKTLVTVEGGVCKLLEIGDDIYAAGNNKIISLLGYDRYAVLRPSMVTEAPGVTISDITITSHPSKMEYRDGEPFDPTGMIVSAVLSNNEQRRLVNYEVSVQKITKATKTVEISFGEFKKSFDVTVLDELFLTSVSDARKEDIGSSINVAGIVVGVAHEGLNNDEELLIKDLITDDIIAVRNIPSSYGMLSNLYGYKSGDVINLRVTVMKDASSSTCYNLKKYLNFSSENGTQASTIVSHIDDVTYLLDNVTTFSTWAEMKAFFKNSQTPYAYVKLTEDVFIQLYSGSDPVLNYRVHKNADGTTSNDYKVDGTRRIVLRDDVMTAMLGADWAELLVDTSAEGLTASKGVNTGKEFYAIYIGGNGSYYQLVILDADWISAKANDEIENENPEKATVIYPDGTTETVAVGDTIIPKAFTDGLYYGMGNTLFMDDATEGWIFTVEGKEGALADLTVTEAMVGKTIIASGADKVYYSAKTADGTTYNLSADTYANDLRALLRNTPATQTVTLYADVTIAATYTWCSTTYTLNFDLNGHTLTITGQTSATYKLALDCSSDIYIYSSTPGAVIDVPDASYFFRTNNRKVSTESDGYFHIGESETSTGYGKNLTVYCKQINNDMYSTEAHILGGTFIQRENSNASYFLLLSRPQVPGQNHFKTIKNATFIVTKSGTSPLYWAHQSKTFTNCNFINATDTYVPLMAKTLDMTSSGSIGTPTFSGCSFYNIIPAKRMEYIKSNGSTATHTATYKNCSFGFSDYVPGEDLDIAEATVMHLAYAANATQKEIAGKTYAMNASLYTDASCILKITWDGTVDFWEIGTKPSRVSEDVTLIKDGVYYSNPVFDLSSVSQIDAEGYVIAAGEAAVKTVFANAQTIAFTYRDTALNELHFAFITTEAPDAAAIGEQFYELFHAPAAGYEIVLYQDMLISKAMGFGALETQYASLAKGNITLDLGGKTLTIAADSTAVNLSNSNSAGYLKSSAVFGFEGSAAKTFTLKSSAVGGKLINLSSYAVVGVGERDKNMIVIEGENLTVDSKGTIVANVEVSGTSLTVSGGTYIYRGTGIAFVSTGGVNIKDAIFVLKSTSADALFGIPTHLHVNAAYTVSGIRVYAEGANLFGYASNQTLAEISSLSNSDNKTVNFAFSDSTLVGIKFVNTKTGTNSITYLGDMAVDTAELLAVAFPDAEGKVAALSQTAYDGVTYRVVSYLDLADAGVVDWGFGITEYWKPGETATHKNAVIDGVFGYTFAPISVLVGTNTATPTLSAIKPGTLQMNLVLQSKIGVNLFVNTALSNATVSFGGETYALADLIASGNYYALETAIAPNVADKAITVVITIGGNAHTVPVSIEEYATKILAETENAEIMKAQNLTYAMVEYVRVMAKNSDFLADVAAPAGYETQTLIGAESENNGTLLSSIAFQLNDTIAIAIKGTADAEGKDVNLVLATGRSEWATVNDATSLVIFKDLYVNEFFGEMAIKIDNETYTYSLANYLKGIEAEYPDEATAVQALYNYAYYANAYVNTQ